MITVTSIKSHTEGEWTVIDAEHRTQVYDELATRQVTQMVREGWTATCLTTGTIYLTKDGEAWSHSFANMCEPEH